MPTDHLHKHGTSACTQTLFLSLSGGATEYFRGGWEYLRAGLKTFGELGVSTGQQKMCLSIFGAQFTTFGELSIFPGSVENLRARRHILRGRVYYFRE